MINSDMLLRQSSEYLSGPSGPTRSISLPLSRCILQEVTILPPPYGADEVPPPLYAEEEVDLPPPETTLSSSSLEVGGGVVSLGLEAVTGNDRDRYLLRFTYPVINRQLAFSSRCVGVYFFFKYVTLMFVFLLLGIGYGNIRELKLNQVKDSFHFVLAVINYFSSVESLILLGMVAGYCWRIRSTER
ncbi:hypothetical protein [Candidatus Ichthyocystis hellenicum]|uniref:hypothetical protein n=1 Tax=Candidatus Ichthyocystis hellenicum TaxID=1561003 RepID=UPI000B87FED0|nr:hypothetical protein [Candidatus Ichthyocystis hellenicum]